MIFRLSDYDKNRRDPDAIVYTNSCGPATRLTRKDFANDAEFRYWKKVSDIAYQEQAPADREWSDKTAEWSDNTSGAENSPEDYFFERLRMQELRTEIEKLFVQLKSGITNVQYRRFRMFVIDGLSQRLIAKIEGVSPVAISKSIRAARKAARKIYLDREG